LSNNSSLYDLLRNAEVFETDGITSELHLSQKCDTGDAVFKFKVSRSELHIEKDEAGLKVYVPRDPASQDVCYYHKLPIALTSWMMASRGTQTSHQMNEAAVRIVNSVLNARKSALRRILESEGIMDVDYISDEDDENVQSVTIEGQMSTTAIEQAFRENDNDEDQSEGTSTEQLPTPPSPSVTGREGVGLVTNSSIEAENTSATYSRAVFRTATPSHGYRSPIPSPGAHQELNNVSSREITAPQANTDLEYLRILETTIKVARSVVIRSKGSFNMAGLLNALPTGSEDHGNVVDQYTKFRSTSQIERDRRIGAAGELFVRDPSILIQFLC
jgi:hypothetical protein